MILSPEAAAAARALIACEQVFADAHHIEEVEFFIYPEGNAEYVLEGMGLEKEIQAVIDFYREAGKLQRASREDTPGKELRAVRLFPRDPSKNMWMVQPAYHGVGLCGITTIVVPYNRQEA